MISSNALLHTQLCLVRGEFLLDVSVPRRVGSVWCLKPTTTMVCLQSCVYVDVVRTRNFTKQARDGEGMIRGFAPKIWVGSPVRFRVGTRATGSPYPWCRCLDGA
jgi:hypothetical protein